MYGYIYKTTNLFNSKIYIGKKKGKFTNKYLGSGVFIKQSIKKYGKEKFRVEVLEYSQTVESLNILEKKHIAEYRQLFGKNKLYNISNGGGGTDGSKWIYNPITLKRLCIRLDILDSFLAKGWKLGANKKDKNNPMFNKGYLISGVNNGMHKLRGKNHPLRGKKLTKEHKNKLKGNRIEREIRYCKCGCGYSKECKINEQWKYKRGHHIKRNNNPSVTHPENLKNRRVVSGKDHPMYGKKHSRESIDKMRKALKGRIPWNKGLKLKGDKYVVS